MRIRHTTALLAAGLVLAAGALSACSGDDEPTADPSDTPSPGAATSSDPAADGGVVSEDGDVTTYQSVPPGFPDDVPILDESEATGSVSEYDGLRSYSVVMPSDGAPLETLQEAATLVAEEGFEGDAEVTEENGATLPVVLTKADPAIRVIITGTELDGGGTLLTYTAEVG